MNLIAIDIGNTNITLALYLDNQEKQIDTLPGTDTEKLANILKEYWEQIPVLETSKEKKRNGVLIVSSVKPAWTKIVEGLAKDLLSEKIKLIGRDIPLPIDAWVDEPDKVGTDRLLTAATAYAVAQQAVVVADFGTALTIDMVDDNGIFQGGVIIPGFAASSKALSDNTSLLPETSVKKPEEPYGKNTAEAINNGLYFAAVGALQEVIRRFAEKHGTWPQTVITGSAAKIIKDDCDFIDNYVTDLVVKGIALAYVKYVEGKQ
jgi:type III pantothenate kinase